MTRARKLAFALLARVFLIGAAVGATLFRYSAKTVAIDVDFRLTPLEKNEGLAGVPVRLVLGDARGWQDADAGHRFVTDADGRAHFTMTGTVDRRWTWQPIAQTGLSIPSRSDHLQIAAELEQPIPRADGHFDRYPWLHVMDIDCMTPSDCSTSDITGVYTRDASGRFTRGGEWRGTDLSMPELNGMLLTGAHYKASDFFLSTSDPARNKWNLRLVLQRKPDPVRR